MVEITQHQNITVRGGVMNVPNSSVHHLPIRHQPNTPTRKPKGQQKPVSTPPTVPAVEPPVPPKPETETVPEE